MKIRDYLYTFLQCLAPIPEENNFKDKLSGCEYKSLKYPPCDKTKGLIGRRGGALILMLIMIS